MVGRAKYTGLSQEIFRCCSAKVSERSVASELARVLRVTRSAISSKLRNEIPWKAAEVEAIAAWLGVPVGALYGEALSVPVMGQVAANPSPEVTYDIGDEPDEFLEVPRHLCAFTVRDNSMVPLARPGQRVLVDARAEVLPGDLVVARLLDGESEGAWLFKRFERQKLGKGLKAILVSVAPGYPPLILPEQSVQLWKAVGLWLLPSPRWSGLRG